jgi:hypothetical protein
MIKFEKKTTKEWIVHCDEYESFDLNFITSSVTGKYHIVAEFIEKVSVFHGNKFDEWFFKLLNDCKDYNLRSAAIFNSIDKIKNFVDTYLESLNIDYNKFVDKTKSNKNSILFEGDEVKEIIKISSYLKIYSVISNNKDLKLGQKLHKDVYNKFTESIIESDIISKIFDVIKIKTFRYNLTDKFMWDYIKIIQCKDVGTHIIEIFNFIMNNIIILCEEHKNPIIFFIGVINESIKWFLRSVYKGSIVYNDEIATEDIHSTHISNLKTYSFNDTLGRLKNIAYEKIYEQLDRENINTVLNKSDQYIIDFNNRLSNIKYISPLSLSLVFPILSEITSIPYIHFKTISPEHSVVLSYYLNRLLKKVFKTEYSNLFSLLDNYPEMQPSVNTTYKIKSIHEFIKIQDTIKNFYGFNTKMISHSLICHYVGRLSRINFVHLITNKKLSGIPLSKIELDMIQFYTLYFAGKLKSKINNVGLLLNKNF